MENASKALIIAGAILLSILLISLGIMIFNQASGVINSNSMNELEIQQFNQQFLQYQGSRVRGSTVNAMIQKVVSNNLNQDDAARQVSIDGSVTVNEGDAQPKTVPTSGTYSVTLNYSNSGADKGLINSITIATAS